MSSQRVVFIGSKALGACVLKSMYSISPQSLAGVITVDDSDDIRCALEEFQEFEKTTGIPSKILKKPSELKSAIVAFQPTLCIVVGWYWVIKKDILVLVPGGWLGVHASLLPKYRGGAPLVWAIINGETKTGISLFYFDDGMDTGDLVAQKELTVDGDDTISDLLAKTEVKTLEMIREQYPLLLVNKAKRIPQKQCGITYVALRKPSDGNIDWNLPAQTIYNFIRAQTHPYPGAFCYWGGNRLRIWRAKPFVFPYYGPPGQVVQVAEDHVIVTCGEGTALCLYIVQPDNMDEQNAANILKFGTRLE